MARNRDRRARNRDESGATAVMVALLALVLLGAGALAVDVGQVMAKRSALQSNVDHAVMAAAAELTSGGSCNPEVIATAEAYLTKAANEVPDQATVDLTGSSGDGDGYITCNNWRVDLWAPTSHISYGLARAVTDTEGVDVPAHAAAQIKSPSTSKALPMYAVSGCDNGPQQIADPPPGHSSPGNSPPDLPDGSPPYNSADFTVNPTEVESGTPAPVAMTLTGTGLVDVVEVGFSQASGAHHVVTPSSPPTDTEVQIGSVPAEVLATDGVWWVRVWDGTRWSRGSEAQPFTVGDLLFCDGAVSGNFGALKISRSDTTPSNWLARNMIKGPEPVLATYDGALTECANAAPWVTSEHAPPNDGTNCVGTTPGFFGLDATQGLVSGSGGSSGRLDADTTEGCDRSGGSGRTVATPPGPSLNDDQLECFLVDSSYTVADVIAGDPGILSSDILNSPRFFQIPVLPVEAASGSSNFYPIIDFRTGFITMEGSGQPLGTYNGLEFHSNQVQKVNVVLFDDAVLPETAPPVGGEIDYIGSGIKVIVLVE